MAHLEVVAAPDKPMQTHVVVVTSDAVLRSWDASALQENVCVCVREYVCVSVRESKDRFSRMYMYIYICVCVCE